MTACRIVRAITLLFPVVRVTFDDGLCGDIDFADIIEAGGIFAPLADKAYFDTIEISEFGHSIGWNLKDLGNEIDFGADNIRTRIETQKVRELAEQYRTDRTASDQPRSVS